MPDVDPASIADAVEDGANDEEDLAAAYEAGPTGYGLARRARADGIEMYVNCPGFCGDWV